MATKGMSLKSGNSKESDCNAFFTSFGALETCFHTICFKKKLFGIFCDECSAGGKNVKKIPFFADISTKITGNSHFLKFFLRKIKSVVGWTSSYQF